MSLYDTKLCHGELASNTYDSMWCDRADLRVEVPNIRPDGSHVHTLNPTPKMENTMTEPTPTDIPKIDQIKDDVKNAVGPDLQPSIDDIKKVIEDGIAALKNPEDPNLVRAKETFGKYQALIFTGVGLAVVYKLNKRAIRKVVRKEILIGLATTPVVIDIPAYMKDVDAYYAAEQAARTAAAWAHTTPAG